MTQSSHAFVRFLNLFRAVSAEPVEGGAAYHTDSIAILAYVSSEIEVGRMVTVSCIVRQQSFGSTPTVLRRLEELHAARLIEFQHGHDKRHKLVVSTSQGEAYLAKCSEMMQNALTGRGQ